VATGVDYALSAYRAQGDGQPLGYVTAPWRSTKAVQPLLDVAVAALHPSNFELERSLKVAPSGSNVFRRGVVRPR
jgi:hypothetical protein